MKYLKTLTLLTAVPASLLAMMGLAFANEFGPVDGGLGLLPAVTPVAERINEFHNFVLVIITVITIFVLGLLIYVMFRFSEKRHPTPTKTTHNTTIEVLWTVIPIFILLAIAWPSFKLLYFAETVEDADMTVKAIGKQWYWTYEYPDHGGFEFDSLLVPKEDLPDDQKKDYLFVADTALVLPVGTNIRFLITATDVLHNFAVPNFQIKLDAVPGRINEIWAYVPEEYAGNTFYGQCSELCGSGHAYMPIMIKMVTKEEFATWVTKAQEEFAQTDQREERIKVAESAAGEAD